MKPRFDDKLKTCIVCGSSGIRRLLTDFRGIDIDECRCGMRFTNPQYSDDYLAEYYTSQYLKEDPEERRAALVEGHDYYLSLIEAAGARPGTLFDIGCGNGYLLEAAIARGWKATGYDVDPVVTAQVSRRLGVPVLNGDFMALDPGGTFSLITMHQVLEHLKNPAAYLDRVRELLDPGGWFFVAVPNIRSLSNRIKQTLESTGLRRRNIGKYYDSDHHLCHFSPPVLAAFLERHGFEVRKIANCHAARPGRSLIGRTFIRYVMEKIYQKSTFLVIARKRG